MRKIIAALLFCVLITAGCAPEELPPEPVIIVTTDALFEIVSAVVGDNIEVVCLLSGGSEIHHYEPTARDAKILTGAFLIVYNGMGLDNWAHWLSMETPSLAAAESVSNVIEGDPHTWLSPRYAADMALAVRNKLRELDPESEPDYTINYNAFAASLAALSEKYYTEFEQARLDTFVTGHAAFAYLAAEFGLTQKSVSDVFSASEPTAAQLAELADYCNENGVKFVLSESSAPRAVSETLANECGAAVLSVYMMESKDGGDMSFLERMDHNLSAVLTALT